MVRLADLPQAERDHHLDRLQQLPEFSVPKLVPGVPLNKRRIAIVTTAGLHVRDDQPYEGASVGMEYRVIPESVDSKDLVMSHVSVNFDRSGFQSDLNVVFPLDRLKELVTEKLVGSVAKFHYAFMGATWPVTKFESKARELAALLKQDHVDAVLLSPV